MKVATQCGGLKNERSPIERPDAKRGRREAQAIILDEDHLFDLMNEDWPEERPRKLYLGGGMVCLMHPAGEVSIKLKYRYQGKEQQLHLGELGNIPTDEIMEKYRTAKSLLRAGSDPRGEFTEEGAAAILANLLDAQARLEDYMGAHFPRKS